MFEQNLAEPTFHCLSKIEDPPLHPPPPAPNTHTLRDE